MRKITQYTSLDFIWKDVWNTLASSSARHPFHQVVLATHTAKAPGLRTVIFRGLDEQKRLKVFTDYRSSKVLELKKYPEASLLFYDPEVRIQLKINVQVQIHYDDQVSQQYWKQVQQGRGWKDYSSVASPGMILQDPTYAYEWSQEEQQFCVLLMRATEVEVLQLRKQGHLRAKFERGEEQWKQCWIAP
ncbi:pyridoxamine 5'-phosphate oxidase family protein [Algivirga pacifica]|uniref:Pyridoxamine 5'-phosphate oxidase Alr4036 family FMN-binding domain-containing protein n=1 Tax=Algivirga pacifica TaxID=1162670 RepID=A0ABP9DD57_9BACT